MFFLRDKVWAWCSFLPQKLEPDEWLAQKREIIANFPSPVDQKGTTDDNCNLVGFSKLGKHGFGRLVHLFLCSYFLGGAGRTVDMRGRPRVRYFSVFFFPSSHDTRRRAGGERERKRKDRRVKGYFSSSSSFFSAVAISPIFPSFWVEIRRFLKT